MPQPRRWDNRMNLTARLTILAAFSLLSVSAAQAAWQERGDASWYGGYHQGRRSSDGSVFDARAMTAAHTSLPLGSVVRVTSDTTGQSVTVIITDRLPQKRTRVIDLSRGAASRIGLVEMGVGPVTIVNADGAIEDDALDDDAEISPSRYGRPHMRRARPTGGVGRQCCQRPSVIQVRSSVPRPAAPRKL